jgi:hypothetical protein
LLFELIKKMTCRHAELQEQQQQQQQQINNGKQQAYMHPPTNSQNTHCSASPAMLRGTTTTS